MNFVKSIYSPELLNLERYKYPPHPEVLLFLILVFLVSVSYLFTDVKVWGHKTESMLDIWSFAHIATGITVSSIAINLRKVCFHPLLLLLLLVVAWEVYEPYAETIMYHVIVQWFGGTEHWINRGLVDPMCAILGFYIVKNNPSILPYARLFSFCFLFLHVAILQDSMYFH